MKKILLIMVLGLSFGINAQTIQSVNPNSGTSGETLQVTITGNATTFSQISGTNGASFYNNLGQGFMASSFQFVSETEIIADVTIPYFMPTGAYDAIIYTTSGSDYYLADAFNVTNTANTISGHVGVDLNGNGCDASDMDMAGIRVNINDGTTDSFTFTNSAGDYTFSVPAGTFVVTPQPEMPYFVATPISGTINFPTQNSLSQTQDFCVAPSGVFNDLYISIMSYIPARPGFDATYMVVYKNIGNQTMTGTVNFVFDDSRLDFVSANPVVGSQTLNNLNWAYVNLLPFESRTIYVTLNVNSPMETPAVNIGDTLPFVVTANPVSGDEMPENNTANLNQIVVGSYDPNDKAVSEGSEIDIADVGNYLHYLIRFQNSGTFLAENVVVKDILQSQLDPSTLEITSASHPYRSTLTAGNKLEFFFENIMLPAEQDDEPGSHGFIAFKIKPANGVTVGSIIENTAEIYFDFNFPIITNTTSTTVTVLGTKGFSLDDDMILYPNPVGNILNIETQSSAEITSVKFFNQLGQLVKMVNDVDQIQKHAVEVGDLKTGMYFIHISSSKGTSIKKIIKN